MKHPVCCSLKFSVSLCFELIFTWYTSTFSLFRIFEIFGSEPPYVQIYLNRRAQTGKTSWSFTIKVNLHFKWLTTENFRIRKQWKVDVYQIKISSKHKTTLISKGGSHLT